MSALGGFLNGLGGQLNDNKDREERARDRSLMERMMAMRTDQSPDAWGRGRGPVGGIPADSAALISEFEGFRETPYWDVNAHRVGYGSDTITRADGTVVPVTTGMSVTREDAQRDLDRRISTEFRPSAVRAVGEDTYGRLSRPQQAVLDSLAYNYGAGAWDKGLSSVREAIRSGGDVAGAIRGLSGHNDGINAKRRAREADLWGASAASDAAPEPSDWKWFRNYRRTPA